jgi:hypothetical protein
MLMTEFSATWKLLIALATAFVAVVTTFVLPPPYSGTDVLTNFSRYFVAIALGILVALLMQTRSQTLIRGWAIASVLLLALGSAGFATYAYLRSAWTSPCGVISHADETMVVGSESDLTDIGREAYARAKDRLKYQPSPAEVLDGAYPLRDRLWNKSTTDVRKGVLAVSYISVVVILSLIPACVAQLLACAGAAKTEATTD